MSYLNDVSGRMKKNKQRNRIQKDLNNQESENIAKLRNRHSTDKLDKHPVYADPPRTVPAGRKVDNGALRRKKYIKSAITAKVNTTGNARSGKSYFEEYDKKKGGYWHTYDNGKRVFVKKHGTTTLPKKGQTGGTYKYLNRSQSA